MGRITYNCLMIVLMGYFILFIYAVQEKQLSKGLITLLVFGGLFGLILIQGIRRRTLNLPFIFPPRNFINQKHWEELKRMHLEKCRR